MVSAFPTCLAAVLALAASTSVSAADLAVGDYFRPTNAVGSSNVTSAEYFRTPCPALNTLANHGYLPRDGKDVTPAIIRSAIMDRYNIDVALAKALTDPLPTMFNLNFLSTHGFIEHDASLVHADAAFGADAAAIDAELLEDMLSHADETTQSFSVESMGVIRHSRAERCRTKNPGCVYGTKELTTSVGEAALVLVALGDATTATASVANVKSFFQLERFPEGFFPRPVAVTAQMVKDASTKIVAIETSVASVKAANSPVQSS